MKTLLVMLLALAAPVPGQDQGHVTKLLRDTIAIYDKDGNPLGREPKWNLPKGGAPIVARNAAGQVGIRRGDQVVFLRNSEIVTSGVPDPCATMGQGARGAKSHSAASEGIGSGMSDSSTPCVRR
jgi:hypothetical protein